MDDQEGMNANAIVLADVFHKRKINYFLFLSLIQFHWSVDLIGEDSFNNDMAGNFRFSKS